MGLPRRVGRGICAPMSALAYDTHRAVKSLVAAGFDPTRAEAVVATVGDAMTGTVATNADVAALEASIAELRADVKADVVGLEAGLVEVRADVKADIAALDARITVLQGDVETLKTDVTDLKADVSGLKTDGAALKAEVAGLRVDMSAMKAELYRLVLLSSVAIVGLTVALMKLIP